MGMILLLLSAISSFSQGTSVEDYIQKYSSLAVEEMNKWGVPASITLAQGILESGSGNSELARKANNHFGIKCHKEWKGKTFHMDDDEKGECFRKYDSPEDSYHDHSDFLVSRDRYDFLFLLEVTDYKSWAHGLKKAGYATNPRYADLLIRIIEENKLYLFDEGKEWEQKTEVRRQKEVKTDSVTRIGLPYEAIPFGEGGDHREMFLNNTVIFIYSREGDTWEGIAREFGIYGWQVRKYNELRKKDEIVAGEVIYLEKKRNKALKESHTVKSGETMRNISQRYGVKEKALCRLNDMKAGSEPEAGKRLVLR
jgi:hypothetical protein